ncbi:hypothetical protein AB0F91_25420 [Amycolatopsis sp. NPDC023774]|uniref:hypothetical protein n=1 Tax=Amycolatopsis sp. NPDC023774 TaxID=3155015 RepID=UPI0033C39A3D
MHLGPALEQPPLLNRPRARREHLQHRGSGDHQLHSTRTAELGGLHPVLAGFEARGQPPRLAVVHRAAFGVRGLVAARGGVRQVFTADQHGVAADEAERAPRVQPRLDVAEHEPDLNHVHGAPDVTRAATSRARPTRTSASVDIGLNLAAPESLALPAGPATCQPRILAL